MKAVVFLCMVILGGFVLLGRLSGDMENLREQKRALETALQAAQETLEKAQSKVAEVTQLLDKVRSERDQVADTILALRQTISDTLQERDQALSTVGELRLALSTAVQERDHALAAIQDLNLAVSIAHHDRDQALAKAKDLETRVQDLTRALEIAQATIQSRSSESGILLQKDDLAPMFILVVVMVLIGYSGAQRVPSFTRRQQRMSTISSGHSSEAGVWVYMPRTLMADYARWARQMQATTLSQRTPGERNMK